MGKKEAVSISLFLHLSLQVSFLAHISHSLSRSLTHTKLFPLCCQEEELEAQVSFLQGQINDLEAMSKYCAKMMNTHIGKFPYIYIY